jgi:hypothetical protein
MIRCLILVAPLLLCSCDDWVQQAVASCTIDALKIHPENRAGDNVISEYVQFCMTAAGYIVDTDEFTCENDNRGASCYHSPWQRKLDWLKNKLKRITTI